MYRDSTDFIEQGPTITPARMDRLLVEHGITFEEACKDSLFLPLADQWLDGRVDTEELMAWLGY